METERYSIIFSSSTGNTKELADTIYEALPKEKCDYFGVSKEEPQSDKETLELLKKLKNKKIFLFGTAGFGGSQEYFQKVLGQIKESIDSSNTIIGEYMCQGKMPQSVRERYVKMKEQPNHMPNLDMMIKNFDSALSHPDKNDLDKLRKMVAE